MRTAPRRGDRRSAGRTACVAAATAALALLTALAAPWSGSLVVPVAAGAAGSGYSPGGSGPGGTGAGTPGTVVSSSTIQPSGGTARGVFGGTVVTVSVPPGTFTGTVQVVLRTVGLPAVPGGWTVASFTIQILEDGVPVTGTFPPLTVTVRAPGIAPGSSVYVMVGSTLHPLGGVQVRDGSVTFAIDDDPTIEVVDAVTSGPASPAVGAAAAGPVSIAGATSASTGQPFLRDDVAGVLLVLVGLALTARLAATRRRSDRVPVAHVARGAHLAHGARDTRSARGAGPGRPTQ